MSTLYSFWNIEHEHCKTMVYSRKTFIKREAVPNAPLLRGRRTHCHYVRNVRIAYTKRTTTDVPVFSLSILGATAMLNYLHNIGLVKNALELATARRLRDDR